MKNNKNNTFKMKSTINSNRKINNSKKILKIKGNRRLISRNRKNKKIAKKNDSFFYKRIIQNDDIF